MNDLGPLTDQALMAILNDAAEMGHLEGDQLKALISELMAYRRQADAELERPTQQRCGWCVRAVGDADAKSWLDSKLYAYPDEIIAHSLACEHNPLVAQIAELKKQRIPARTQSWGTYPTEISEAGWWYQWSCSGCPHSVTITFSSTTDQHPDTFKPRCPHGCPQSSLDFDGMWRADPGGYNPLAQCRFTLRALEDIARGDGSAQSALKQEHVMASRRMLQALRNCDGLPTEGAASTLLVGAIDALDHALDVTPVKP